MIVETKVEGSAEAVRAAADWLRDTWQQALLECSRNARSARQQVGDGWTGQAAYSYAGVSYEVMTAAADEAERAVEAAGVLDRLARRMLQREDAMEAIRGRAATAGLVVTGTLVRHIPRSDIGIPTTPEEQALKDHEDDLTSLLIDLRDAVEDANNAFCDWVDGELADAVASQRRHAAMTSLGEVGTTLATNLVKNGFTALSSKAELGYALGDLAIKTATGDVGVDDLVTTLGGKGVEAVTSTVPAAVLGGTLLDSASDLSEQDESGRDPLAPDHRQPSVRPGRIYQR